jgi:hypothetical protein
MMLDRSRAEVLSMGWYSFEQGGDLG